MQTTIPKTYLMGAIAGAAPHLIEHFERLLLDDAYTIDQLNTLFRYHLIQLSNNTLEVRDWLCESPDYNLWIHYFCQNVIPFINHCLVDVYVSPQQQLKRLEV
jgi:hypothetical protein